MAAVVALESAADGKARFHLFANLEGTVTAVSAAAAVAATTTLIRMILTAKTN